MANRRTNDEWLSDLGSEDAAVQDEATSDMQRSIRNHISAQFIKRGLRTSCVDDIVQEASLRIFSRISTFRGESRFLTWATAVAVRTGLELIRRGFWETKTTVDLMADERIDLVAQWQSTSLGPPVSAQQREVLNALEDAMNNSLTVRQRCVLIRELQGQAVDLIARELGTTRGAVYKLTHDARKKLRRVLERAGFDGDSIQSLFAD